MESYKETLMKEALLELAPLLRKVEKYALYKKEMEKMFDLHELSPYVRQSLEIYRTLKRYEKWTNDEYFFFDKKLVWKTLKQCNLEELAPVLDKYVFCGIKAPKPKRTGTSHFYFWFAMVSYLIFIISVATAIHTKDWNFISNNSLWFTVGVLSGTLAKFTKYETNTSV